MHHSDFIAPRPPLEFSRRGEGRARSLAGQVRRRVHGRRLAFIDSHFPCQRSGFRYADALALYEARPDTVFFSTYEMRDPFPAPVLALARFPRVAPSLGITDVYGVSAGFMAGALGLRGGEGPDLSGVLQREGIRTHVGLFPGGGFLATEAGFDEARRLVATADQAFSWLPVALEQVPGVTPIDPGVIDTAFYARTERDFAARPLELMFVADAQPREGLDVVLAAVEVLAGEPVHLHVVGPHDTAQSRVPSDTTTFHGWLDREGLRELHRRCHVFVSPATADGFPTAPAAEAVASGLLLLTANPEADHRHLRPGIDHIELPATAGAYADAVRAVLAEPGAATAVAESGAQRVRERLDVRAGVAARLALMGFNPGRTPFAPRGRRASADTLAADLGALRASLAEIRTEHRSLADQVQAARRDLLAIGEEVRAGRQELSTTRRDIMTVGQLALDDESAARHALRAARSAPDYEAPFTDSDPLVTVCIPTHANHKDLLARSIPSALAQDHRNIEVVVVGDAAPPETAAGIERLNDPRVRYENLAVRGPYPDDPRERWLVAGTGPLNRAFELARGAWIAVDNDDDALRPDHVSTLLAQAQRSRDEVVYGCLVQHAPDGSSETIGEFPPVNHGFGWQLALQHRAMRLFEFKLSAALFGEPGDWDRTRRMLRAGVRFRMIDHIVCEYYPSTLWRPG
jgi:glycosyltransferase involved in cell wall biosynthesis